MLEQQKKAKLETNETTLTTVALNKQMSLQAKGLYLLIQLYKTNTQLVLDKSALVEYCSNGQGSFDSAWNELKRIGYLKIYKISGLGKYMYFYDLLKTPCNDIPSAINLNANVYNLLLTIQAEYNIDTLTNAYLFYIKNSIVK